MLDQESQVLDYINSFIHNFSIALVLSHTYLNNTLHEVLLSDGVSTLYHLFQHVGQHLSLVHPGVNGVKLGETDKVCPDEDPQLESLFLSPLPLPRVALVLHADPKLVHLGKVVKDERDGVFNGAILATGG